MLNKLFCWLFSDLEAAAFFWPALREEMMTFYSEYQMFLQGICTATLVAMIGFVVLCMFSQQMDKYVYRRPHTTRFAKCMVSVMVAFLSFYAVTKQYTADYVKVGSDSSIQLKEVCVTYDTNTCHNTITIAWTNGFNAVTLTTPFAYREASSNEWTSIEFPQDAIISTDPIDPNLHTLVFEYTGTTNSLENFSHWWVGTDRPAVEIIVVSDDLEITVFEHDSEHIYLEWSITDEIADAIHSDEESYYTIQYTDDGGKTWVDIASTRNEAAMIPGFWYGKDREWRVQFVLEIGAALLMSDQDEGSDK